MKIGEITEVDRRANSDQTTRLSPGFWFLLAALAATGAKLLIAWNTIGTNDTVVFFLFGRELSIHGLAETYRRSFSSIIRRWLPITCVPSTTSPISISSPITTLLLRFFSDCRELSLTSSRAWSFGNWPTQ
jgi:hypothetical protein